MSLLDDILRHNTRFVEDRARPLSKQPHRKVAIFTCMDTRLVDFLEPALGIGRGDAQMIKNAGNTLVDPGGGVVRSLVVAIHGLGCEEVLVIGHTDCGMAQIEEGQLAERMFERGVPRDAVKKLTPSLREWLGAFHDPARNVEHVVSLLRQNPLIPGDVPIHGLIFDPLAGSVRKLVDGYAELARGGRSPLP